MRESIKMVLQEKGMKVSEWELSMLEHQWKSLQQLKKGIETLKLNDADIVIIHRPRGMYRGETIK